MVIWISARSSSVRSSGKRTIPRSSPHRTALFARRLPAAAAIGFRIDRRNWQPSHADRFGSNGRRATANWPGPLARATKQPLTLDSVREQLGRLGDTPFELGGATKFAARRDATQERVEPIAAGSGCPVVGGAGQRNALQCARIIAQRNFASRSRGGDRAIQFQALPVGANTGAVGSSASMAARCAHLAAGAGVLRFRGCAAIQRCRGAGPRCRAADRAGNAAHVEAGRGRSPRADSRKRGPMPC